MHDPVYRGSSRHGVGEHLLPLGEDQVRGDAKGTALVALGYQSEQHLGLIGTLRQVAQVVYDQQVEVVELPEHPRQIEVSLGRQHILHQAGTPG